MYVKCSRLECAAKVFDRMSQRDCVSWNTMMFGYSVNRKMGSAQSLFDFIAAHKCFSRMLQRAIRPDNFLFATFLTTCSDEVNAGLGKQIHAQIIKQSMQSDTHIINTLVDMSSKCGNMHDSILVFRKLPNRDVVTWNSMVCAYARHGSGNEALQAFEEILLEKVTPNHVIFNGVLSACAYMGLVDEALHYFHMMKAEYGLETEIEQYSYVVDALVL